MSNITNSLVGLVAALHIAFFVGEFFLWEKIGPKLLKTDSVQMIADTKTLAANQGVYNLFLAAGLIWALFYFAGDIQASIILFFLGFIVLAGLYGWYSTGSINLFLAQSVPAIVAFGAVYFRGGGQTI